MPGSTIDHPFLPTHVDATTLVRAAECVLHTIVINEIDGAVIVVYDGVDAGVDSTIVGVINSDLSQPITLIYDCKMNVGIYITIGGEGTADITVNWK